MGQSSHRIRAIDPGSAAEVELVASKMRATLIEVLGEEAGRSLYTLDWLRQRVLWHLDPGKSTAAVFLSENRDGHITGHTIVRIELDDAGHRIGLFSTTFVEPESRKQGIATHLLVRGEEWMAGQKLVQAVTYTSEANGKLINLYQRQGYTIIESRSGMVRLAKALPNP